MEYWRQGMSFDPLVYGQQRVEVLKMYGCKPEHIEQAKQTIGIRAGVLLQGGMENKCTQLAVAWLNEHAPDLCGL